MYIRQDTLNVGDDNRIRYSLYNINGFPQNIVNNIGSIVSIYLDKKVVDKLSPFLPIKIKPDKTRRCNRYRNKKNLNTQRFYGIRFKRFGHNK